MAGVFAASRRGHKAYLTYRALMDVKRLFGSLAVRERFSFFPSQSAIRSAPFAIILANSYIMWVALQMFVAIDGASASDRCRLSQTRHPARRSGPSKRPIPKR